MASPTAPPAQTPPFSLQFSRHFESWLADFNASIAFTTYQAGKVFMLGMGESGINDVLLAFRAKASAEGIGYQTLINQALRSVVVYRPIDEDTLRPVLREGLGHH